MIMEVFKSGIQTDSGGNTSEWSEAKLKKIADSYNPKLHEAPIVIGHPKTNSPAYGWVKSLSYKNGSLFAESDLVPEMKEWLKKGLYKKRSIALDKNGNLRHIGFLGAMPPAVKGLEDVQFSSDEDVVYIEFSENEAELENRALRAEIEALKSKERKAIHSALIKPLSDSHKILPTEVPQILEFMEAIDNKDVFEFSESFKEANPVEYFVAILERIQPTTYVGEFATSEKAYAGALSPHEYDVAKKLGVSPESFHKAKQGKEG